MTRRKPKANKEVLKTKKVVEEAKKQPTTFKDKLEVFDFGIEIDGQVWQNDLKEVLQTDRTNLEAEFSDHAKNFAYYATLYEMAKDFEARCKRAKEIAYAQVDFQVRQEAQNTATKITEKMVENQTKTHEVYQKAELQYLESKKMSGVLGAVKEALNQKRDMLVGLGANARAQGSLRIMTEEAKEKIKERNG